MKSKEEPNSIFGGFAVPSWNCSNQQLIDPPEKCSWIFKITQEEKSSIGKQICRKPVILEKWACRDKQYATFGKSSYQPIFGKFERQLKGLGGVGVLQTFIYFFMKVL
eukprot:TRINITY_DN4999_c0_g1_i4.p2 TRINITY_DN4999_c0_g1~~TRINITY_DN4999_c0_g1_i4.p2  ORF type:complete len:108 (-),score=17.06 TRINITY_DN4999_c0_g1_i4:612-935(-)